MTARTVNIGNHTVALSDVFPECELAVELHIDGIQSFVIGGGSHNRTVRISGPSFNFVEWLDSSDSLAWQLRCKKLEFDGDVWDMGFADGIVRLSVMDT